MLIYVPLLNSKRLHTDGPWIAVNLVHIFFWNATKHALLNNLWVGAAYVLDGCELLHRDLLFGRQSRFQSVY